MVTFIQIESELIIGWMKIHVEKVYIYHINNNKVDWIGLNGSNENEWTDVDILDRSRSNKTEVDRPNWLGAMWTQWDQSR